MTDPYSRNMFGKQNPYYAKKPVFGRIVVVLDGVYENRGLNLIKPPSRALKNGEIHELILTDEQCFPGDTVNRIAYLAFVEITQGSVSVQGDTVMIGSQQIGTIAGYDETHMPNHLNIVLNGKRVSGREIEIRVDSTVVIGKYPEEKRGDLVGL